MCLRFDLKLPVYLKNDNSPDFRDIHFVGVSGYKIFKESQVKAFTEDILLKVNGCGQSSFDMGSLGTDLRSISIAAIRNWIPTMTDKVGSMTVPVGAGTPSFEY